MKRLKVDMAGLMSAFEDASWETNYFLDLETGEVLMFMNEDFHYVDEIPDEPVPEWRQEWLEKAKEVWYGRDERYLSVPEADSHHAYRDMEVFITTVEDEHLRELLWVAIEGRGAFGRFKGVLANHPRERERWFAFKDDRLRRRVLDWLEFEEIEPVIEEPEEWEEEDELPADSEILLAEALVFVRDIVHMPGVERIALLGSLTTEEPEPKDVDLLVTVADDMDLTSLAAAARRLRGHLQHHNLGADAFLADPRGHYLGRTCPWKRCAPGIRVRCDARNCGRRPYLHDDWDAIRLEDKLVRRPPIVLWPQVLAHVPVPEDVQEDLIEPLVDDGITEPAGARLMEWLYEWRTDGHCNRCQRKVPALVLGEELTLCADCLRQGANLLDLCEAHQQGLPWTFKVGTDYSAGPVTWDDVYDGEGHFLFTLYARGTPLDLAEPQAGVYDQPGYYPFGYSGLEAGDGYPDIVAEAETLSIDQVAEACRLWLKVHGLPADGPLVVANGPDELAFSVPGATPVVTDHGGEVSPDE